MSWTHLLVYICMCGVVRAGGGGSCKRLHGIRDECGVSRKIPCSGTEFKDQYQTQSE